MMKRIAALLVSLVLLQACVCTTAVSEAALQPELTHSEARLSMEAYLEADPELMALMEKSIAKAQEINPDPETNPVHNVEELYKLIDWLTVCMPWNVLTDGMYPTLYQSIDQSIDYIWCRMPL